MYRTLAGKLGIAWYQEAGISSLNVTREVVRFLRDVHGRDNLEVVPKAEDTNTPTPPEPPQE